MFVFGAFQAENKWFLYAAQGFLLNEVVLSIKYQVF